MPPKRPGPFRGPTPKKVIQTLDVGTGTPGLEYGLERFKTNANLHQNRYYKGVDLHLEHPIKGPNYDVEWNDVILTVENLIKNGITVRHVNFTYPIPYINDSLDSYYFLHLLPLLKKILLPNGKIFITSEEPKFLKSLSNYAAKFDFVSSSIRSRYSVLDYKRILAQMKIAKQKSERGTTNGLPMSFDQEYFINRGKRPYILILTNSLSKVYPGNSPEAKEQRRNWPRV
jgi:hypothetical protein